MPFATEAEAEEALLKLHRQRDALDCAIADHASYLALGRRLFSDQAASPRSVSMEASAQGHRDVASSRHGYGRAVLSAAVELLREAGSALHARDIMAGLEARGLPLPGADPVAALNTRLWKRSGANGTFKRLGDAVYALREDEGVSERGGS